MKNGRYVGEGILGSRDIWSEPYRGRSGIRESSVGPGWSSGEIVVKQGRLLKVGWGEHPEVKVGKSADYD